MTARKTFPVLYLALVAIAYAMLGPIAAIVTGSVLLTVIP